MSNHDLRNAQSIGRERGDNRFLRVGILESFSADSRVNERDDTTQGSGGGESGVGADRWDADEEGVEVLLSCNETTSSGNGCIACSELRDD